jgi:hypothetical protein
VALHGFVLGDELIASLYATEMLRASPGFGPWHARSARRALALAFSTYAIDFLSYALLLAQWPLVVELTRDPLVPPLATLTALGTAGAAALSVVLAIAAVVPLLGRLVALPRRVRAAGATAAMLARPALFALLLLVWNTRPDPAFAGWVMLALIPAQRYFLIALMLPMAIVDLIVLDRFTKRWIVEITHPTEELKRDLEAGRAQRRSGNRAIAELIERTRALPLFERRLLLGLPLCSLPLLIAIWLA